MLRQPSTPVCASGVPPSEQAARSCQPSSLALATAGSSSRAGPYETSCTTIPHDNHEGLRFAKAHMFLEDLFC